MTMMMADLVSSCRAVQLFIRPEDQPDPPGKAVEEQTAIMERLMSLLCTQQSM